MAFGSGGTWARGSAGLQTPLSPRESHNDFIAAIIGEARLRQHSRALHRIPRARRARACAAYRAPDDYGSYLAFGISDVRRQALVNLCVALAIVPTGPRAPVPPSAARFPRDAAAAGILLNVSRQNARRLEGGRDPSASQRVDADRARWRQATGVAAALAAEEGGLMASI